MAAECACTSPRKTDVEGVTFLVTADQAVEFQLLAAGEPRTFSVPDLSARQSSSYASSCARRESRGLKLVRVATEHERLCMTVRIGRVRVRAKRGVDGAHSLTASRLSMPDFSISLTVTRGGGQERVSGGRMGLGSSGSANAFHASRGGLR